jgi:hypothetical protein
LLGFRQARAVFFPHDTVMQDLFYLDNFNPHQIVADLSAQGATSLLLLREDFRLKLLQEAESASYTLEPNTVGSGEFLVRQQVRSCLIFAAGSPYLLLREAFEALCNEAFKAVSPYPFTSRLRFTEIRLNRHEPGSLGITPHQDGPRYCNLVCLFMIGGQGRFAVCADRFGREARYVDASPGRVTLLRAPGFLASEERPFHYVTDIQDTRYTCGLRHRGPAQPTYDYFSKTSY